MFSINLSLAFYTGLSVVSIALKLDAGRCDRQVNWRGLLNNNPTFPQPPVHPILVRMKRLDVATAIETELTLVDQLKGVELECRIIAINKSGEGSPSNTVIVVL